MNNPVEFGTVEAMPHADIWDKEFPKKVLEEAAEVYGAWELYTKSPEVVIMKQVYLTNLMGELADLTQTIANMAKAVQDEEARIDNWISVVTPQDKKSLIDSDRVAKTYYTMVPALRECHKRNEERGRYEIEGCENDAAGKRD